jgi:hypothetical protein
MNKNNQKEILQAALINLLAINQIMSRLIRILDEIVNEDDSR